MKPTNDEDISGFSGYGCMWGFGGMLFGVSFYLFICMQ